MLSTTINSYFHGSMKHLYTLIATTIPYNCIWKYHFIILIIMWYEYVIKSICSVLFNKRYEILVLSIYCDIVIQSAALWQIGIKSCTHRRVRTPQSSSKPFIFSPKQQVVIFFSLLQSTKSNFVIWQFLTQNWGNSEFVGFQLVTGIMLKAV